MFHALMPLGLFKMPLSRPSNQPQATCGAKLNNEPNTLVFNTEQYNLRCHQHIAWSLTLILTHLNHIDEERLPIRPSSLGFHCYQLDVLKLIHL